MAVESAAAGQAMANSPQGQAAMGLEVEVGGEKKMLSVEDIKGLLKEKAELEDAKKKLEPFGKALSQYGIDADEYLRNSEASFVIINQLIEKGVIDEQGNLVEKRSGTGTSANPPAPSRPAGDTSRDAAVLAALGKIGERIEQLEEGQSGIFRRNIERDVKDQFSNLDTNDVTKLLAKAKADRSKSLWDHAEVLSKEKGVRDKQTRGTMAKDVIGVLIKAGIVPAGKVDLDKLDIDALREQDPATAPPSYEGKTFIFSNRKKRLKDMGKDVSGYADPSSAMKELVDKRMRA